MKISIENFKAIKKLHNFELKPMTILSGVNSSGKSSFVQLLLILKQTIELNSASQAFHLNGEYTKIKNFKDIISNKDLKRKLKISFEFSKSEFNQIDKIKTVSIFNTFSDYNCLIEIEYDVNQNEEIYVSVFSVKFNFENETDKDHFIVFNSDFNKNSLSIDTNSAIFESTLFFEKPIISNIQYSSIYPDKYETKNIGKKIIGDIETNVEEFSVEVINIEDIKTIINTFLYNISYIKPIRDAPKDEYFFFKNHNNVGTDGEFVAQILEEKAEQPVIFYKLIEQEDGMITYEEIKKTLIEAVVYWMCNIFEVANEIKTQKVNEIYRILLVNKSGLETSIKHVGFGISQLLPIVVEGLIMPKNGTLIIEQPEIHLHPKLQSKLYDFLYGLTLQEKKVIVETHSSHFITRMRRRIAEDESNEMDDKINLTFIEDNIFRTIQLNDFGGMEYYPEDFIEQPNSELAAIVKAQMTKRLKNK